MFIEASTVHIFEAEHPFHNFREDMFPFMIHVFAPSLVTVAN
jgi:hypothetical protein